MLTFYHYKKNGQLFMLMNESPDQPFDGRVVLPSARPLFVYDGDLDRYCPLESSILTRGSAVMLRLEPGQSILIMEQSQVPA